MEDAGKVGPREGRGDPGSPKGGLGREVGLFFFKEIKISRGLSICSGKLIKFKNPYRSLPPPLAFPGQNV